MSVGHITTLLQGGSQVQNITVAGCSIAMAGQKCHVGHIAAGGSKNKDGYPSVVNCTVRDSIIEIQGQSAKAGNIFAVVNDGVRLSGNVVSNNTVSVTGDHGVAGALSGITDSGVVARNTVTGNRIIVHGSEAVAGGAQGKLFGAATVEDLTVAKNQITATGNNVKAESVNGESLSGGYEGIDNIPEINNIFSCDNSVVINGLPQNVTATAVNCTQSWVDGRLRQVGLPSPCTTPVKSKAGSTPELLGRKESISVNNNTVSVEEDNGVERALAGNMTSATGNGRKNGMISSDSVTGEGLSVQQGIDIFSAGNNSEVIASSGKNVTEPPGKSSSVVPVESDGSPPPLEAFPTWYIPPIALGAVTGAVVTVATLYACYRTLKGRTEIVASDAADDAQGDSTGGASLPLADGSDSDSLDQYAADDAQDDMAGGVTLPLVLLADGSDNDSLDQYANDQAGRFGSEGEFLN